MILLIVCKHQGEERTMLLDLNLGLIYLWQDEELNQQREHWVDFPEGYHFLDDDNTTVKAFAIPIKYDKHKINSSIAFYSKISEISTSTWCQVALKIKMERRWGKEWKSPRD